MSEYGSVAEYNERVLGIANESNLEEKIPKTKIVQKVMRSLPGKFDMKVTAREEAHDITKLKQDELFGSLLMFEMAISNIENKLVKVLLLNQYMKKSQLTINHQVKQMSMWQ